MGYKLNAKQFIAFRNPRHNSNFSLFCSFFFFYIYILKSQNSNSYVSSLSSINLSSFFLGFHNFFLHYLFRFELRFFSVILISHQPWLCTYYEYILDIVLYLIQIRNAISLNITQN